MKPPSEMPNYKSVKNEGTDKEGGCTGVVEEDGAVEEDGVVKDGVVEGGGNKGG